MYRPSSSVVAVRLRRIAPDARSGPVTPPAAGSRTTTAPSIGSPVRASTTEPVTARGRVLRRERGGEREPCEGDERGEPPGAGRVMIEGRFGHAVLRHQNGRERDF